MKLVLIQGDHLAAYEGREQKGVFAVNWQAEDVDFRALIEEVRLG